MKLRFETTDEKMQHPYEPWFGPVLYCGKNSHRFPSTEAFRQDWYSIPDLLQKIKEVCEK